MEANECQELNYLPPAGRDYYNFCKIQNPSWSHQRIMSKVTESYPIHQCKTASEQRTMNSKEYKDYISLSKEDQEEYDHIKKRKPHWSHEQIMAKLGVDTAIIETLENGGRNPDPTDITTLSDILKKAQEYLRIFSDAVRHTLDSAISKLDDYIKRGASYIGDAISNVIGWLFD